MNNNKKLAQVFHFDLYGKRQVKYDFLNENSLKSIPWTEIEFSENDENYFFVPKDFALKDEYENGFKVDELFPVNTSGVKTHDDANLVSFEKFDEHNQKYDYRPFDTRNICYDLSKVVRARFSVMKHFVDKDNLGLVTCRQQSTFDFQHIFITKSIADMCAVSSQTKETGYIFPLYLYQETFGVTEKIPNLNEAIVSAIEKRLVGVENFRPLQPIDLLDYIYAVLHSPTYRERYKEFLKIDFPRVPYPENSEQFRKLALHGEQLRRLHLMENISNADIADIQYKRTGNTDNHKVENSFTEKSADWHDNRLFINDANYFDGVSRKVYDFYIGGYQPARKWLKDRKGQSLSLDDRTHYRKIVYVLGRTIEIMEEIDK